MPTQVHIHAKVERQLAALEKQGKTRSIAADRSRRIIDALIQGKNPAGAGLLKRKTDRRVKNCLKFDLGAGFRLICVSEGKNIHVLFVGDHDSTDNWLDNHRKKRPHKTELAMHSYTVGKGCDRLSKLPGTVNDVLGDPGFFQLSQEDLRRVFKGLIG
ncbi:MAG: hypothetical protein HUK40_18680 [Desulfobacter sp.]|nr:hypothetical protein [Desulfobacter sp.]WDP86721.1 MAG: hypothetical protein HUN05_17635 [Desulfobacter sp.]